MSQASIKVAVAQMDPQLGAYARNFSRIVDLFEEAVGQGARLTVFAARQQGRP